MTGGGKASPSSLAAGLKNTKSCLLTTSQYGRGAGGGAGRGTAPAAARGPPPAAGRGAGGVAGRPPRSGRGAGGSLGGLVIHSDVPSASGDVASQSTFSQSSQEYVRSPVHPLDHEAESRDEDFD